MDKQLGNTPLLLRPDEAADVLSIGTTKLGELVKKGLIVPVRIDRCVRFRLKDLERYVDGLAGETS